ncbi:MAG: 1-deoxy-D-xylulose-5-phosphate reductoisomerase [Bacteroidetes bacterium]|nr:MAG: 1-deoxy-D-xylulose-5-phosphate reductoisomerase [Bacteroidota bacterium]
MRNVAVLGSTGSIGTQTLEIARLERDRINIVSLTAHSNVQLLVKQAREFRPTCVSITTESLRDSLKIELNGTGVEVLSAGDGLIDAATAPGVDTVVCAVVGSAGVRATMAAVNAGHRIALANKESLVVAGELIIPLARQSGAEIIPVDSEHSAIFQCLVGEDAGSIDHLVLTASGGPFRGRAADSFHTITREEALAHPTWDMGDKITIDSATLMNKGLEVIEAFWLFNLPVNQIRVVVHPQSIIHSMVAFKDGSIKAQLGMPDMKLPIQYALSFPDRWNQAHSTVDWTELSALTFEKPDLDAFPCLRLAYEAISERGFAPAVLNASNEQAVTLFLENEIGFSMIPELVERVLSDSGGEPSSSTTITLDSLSEMDSWARRRTKELCGVRDH